MVGLMKEVVYVTYTCKRCGKAFLDVDPNDDINEIPLKTRYCPDCVAEGFENKKEKIKNTKEQLQKKYLKEQLKQNNITDKRDVSFVRKQFFKAIKFKEKTNQKIFLNYIFKDAIEVLSYQSWKNE